MVIDLQFFGGRGSSSGISEKGNKYGSQFHDVLDTNRKPLISGNIKFIKSNSRESESLFETMSKGRVYAVTGGKDLLKIVYLISCQLMGYHLALIMD